MANCIKSPGGEIIVSLKITSVINKAETVVVSDDKNEFDLIYNCVRLFSDRNYEKFTPKKRPLRIVPFRGEYFMLKPKANKVVNHLIYP